MTICMHLESPNNTKRWKNSSRGPGSFPSLLDLFLVIVGDFEGAQIAIRFEERRGKYDGEIFGAHLIHILMLGDAVKEKG